MSCSLPLCKMLLLDFLHQHNATGVKMLSRKQKDDLRIEWRNCSADEKQVIMAEFIREYGDEPGWEAWLIFLRERLLLPGCDDTFRAAGT